MPFIAEDVIVIHFIQVSYKQQAFLTGIATVVGKSKPIAKQIQQLNFEFSSVDIRASEKMGTALPFLQLMFIFYAPSSTTTLFFATQLVVMVLTSHTAMAYIVRASTRHAV